MFSKILRICFYILFVINTRKQDVLCFPDDDFPDVNFLFLPGNNPKHILLIEPDDHGSLKKFLKTSRETKIIIHDWQTGISSASTKSIIQAYAASTKKFNVIIVDWHKTSMLSYRVAQKSIPKIGKEIGRSIEHLLNVTNMKPSKIHIIADGLGCDIAAFAGKQLNGTIKRITAMEPFRYDLSDVFVLRKMVKKHRYYLKSTDAQFVDIISSIVKESNYVNSTANAFFYIVETNKQAKQERSVEFPVNQVPERTVANYFAESINSPLKWTAIRCDSAFEFRQLCCYGNRVLPLGEATPLSARGRFYMEKRMAQCNAKCAGSTYLEKLETGYKKLKESDSKSLLKKYLTQEVFDRLKTKKTSFGSTLLDCIQSGLENHDSGIGIYAPDAEAYTVFADIFDPIIEDYHMGFKNGDKHPPKDFGDYDSLVNVDPTGKYVVSTRVRCGRSLSGYAFNPCLTEENYKEMEQKVSSTLSELDGELNGKYYPLTGMSKDVQQRLIDDHFLFKEGDRFLQTANACRFWPSGRGIFHNDNKTFLVWVNEEDHLRIISMQKGGDLGEVYRRLVHAVDAIEKRMEFAHHDRFGFLTFCPTNLGTTIRASVHIKVPKLAANREKLEEVAAKYNLQVRGSAGEHSEAVGGIYDISNKQRMGLTEYDAVKTMQDGILEIIKLEECL